MGNAPFVHVLSVAGVISVLSECQPPSEPEVREVQVALRAGGRKAELLDLEVEGWKKNSTIRPSLPQDLAQGGYSEFMQDRVRYVSEIIFNIFQDPRRRVSSCTVLQIDVHVCVQNVCLRRQCF